MHRYNPTIYLPYLTPKEIVLFYNAEYFATCPLSHDILYCAHGYYTPSLPSYFVPDTDMAGQSCSCRPSLKQTRCHLLPAIQVKLAEGHVAGNVCQMSVHPFRNKCLVEGPETRMSEGLWDFHRTFANLAI